MSYCILTSSHHLPVPCSPGIRFGTFSRRPLILLALFFCCLTSSSIGQLHAASDQDEEWQRVEEYFTGLRSRGLHALAETVCHRKLADDRLDLLTRARYAVELSRSLTDHSRTAPTVDQQTELLKQAKQAIHQILDRHRNHPQKLLLESQLAFVTVGELESLRWRAALTPFDQKLIDRALRLADSLIPVLKQLNEQAGREARSRRSRTIGDQLRPYQIRSLQRLIQLKLGTVLLDKARLYPESTPDRSDALTQASEVLRHVAAVPTKDQAMWQSQLTYVTTLRLLGTASAAWDMIKAMRDDDPPPHILDALAAEHVELLIDANRYPDAADYLRTRQKQHRRISGPLSFLTARVYLRLSKIATEKQRPQLAAELLQEVHRAIQLASTTGNNYWAARAQNLLADEDSRNTYGAALGAVVRAGQSLYAAGDTAGAAQRYAEAFETARSQQNEQVAAEIGYTYGSILLKQKLFPEAADVFRLVTALAPSGDRAADADLLTSWCLGMEFRDHPTRERREAYMAALEKHRATWPGSATAAEATWMLAQLQEQLLQTSKALSLYATVPSDHPRYTESAMGIARCSETILNRLRSMKRDRSEWEPAIVELLTPYVKEAMAPQSVMPVASADFLTRVARILIILEEPDFQTADRLLDHVLTSASSATQQNAHPLPEDTIETATGLRIISLAGLGQPAAAMDLLKSTVLLDRDRLSAILGGLSSIAEFLTTDQRRIVGELQLAAVKQAGLNPEELTREELESFGHVIASAFEQTAQPHRAVGIFRQLLATRPRDRTLRRRVAIMLSQMNEAASLTAAQQEFRKLESSYEAGSSEWIDARLHVIELAIQLKNLDGARKLLKITQLLYPNPGDDELKRRLRELSAALESEK